MAGAKLIASPIIPIVNPRLATGIRIKVSVCTKGSMIPTPTACTILPVSSSPKLGETAHRSVPAVSIPMEKTNTCLVVNL
ncbi:hypothetical protein D3C73_1269970 [compost metagenome]